MSSMPLGVLGRLAAVLGGAVLLLVAGCAERAPIRPEPVAAPPALVSIWQEEPVAEGHWRPHLLRRCPAEEPLPRAAQRSLEACWDLYKGRVGSDGIIELEIYLDRHEPNGLVLLTLGQLYLMAGQGEPELLPQEGPAADVGSWPQNKRRLLARAQRLLEEAGSLRPDDGTVDFLLGDVARARGDSLAAHAAVAVGLAKCSLPRSLKILQDYQDLGHHAARVNEGVAPQYPPQAAQSGISGEVVLDLLVDPGGQVVQIVTVASPDASLTKAAADALRQARLVPAKLGKYPIWSWLRVPTRFTLTRPEPGS